MITDLDKIKVIPKEKSAINIAIPLEYELGINFYRAKDNRTWINSIDGSDLMDKRYDYLFFNPEDFPEINPHSFEIIKKYPVTNNVLAKQKYPPNLTKVCFSQQRNFETTKEKIYLINEQQEYSQGFNYTVNDSITPDKNAEVIFNATVKADNILKTNMLIIFSFENAKGCYCWKSAKMNDYIVKANEWTNVSYSVLVPKECVAGDRLNSYIWNPNKQQLSVNNMQLKWLSKP